MSCQMSEQVNVLHALTSTVLNSCLRTIRSTFRVNLAAVWLHRLCHV